ncbi:MAG: hypothetical protein QXK63_02670 [Thermoproteus sp.]
MARRVRLLGALTSLFTLTISLLYNIAITRKLPIEDLGLVTLLNASTAFSLLPNAIAGFAFPRITARDGGLDLRATVGAVTLFFSASAGLTIAYLAAIWGELGPRGPLVAAVALVVEFTTYLSSIASSILMVRDRRRFVALNLLQAAVKLVAIGAIYAARWSVEAVLWSSAAITAAPALYGLYRAAAFQVKADFKRYMRELINAAWVPLMGYAINSFRSLDAAIIGLLGAMEQVGLWYIFFMLSKPYTFSSLLSNITYGELLEGRSGGVYKDLLMVMSLSTIISLSYIFFEPYYVNFLRPGQPQYLAPLLIPLAIWSAANILGNLNFFLANAMQGVDKTDLQNGEIRARSYLGTLVLYAHLAELVFTAVYLGSIVPLMLLAERLGDEYYAITGVVSASALANAAALAFRLVVTDRKSVRLVDWGTFVEDYVPPLLATSVALYFISKTLVLPLVPSVFTSIAEVILALLITASVYVGLSAAMSRNFRVLLTAVLKNLLSILNKLSEK